jgi:GAF domain-containing protein
VPEAAVDLLELVATAPDTAGYLEQLTASAVELVPGAEAASLTLEQRGRDRTVALSGDLAVAGDERQYQLDDGPCLAALRDGAVVDAPDLATETRWAPYGHRAAAAGVAAALCLPLTLARPTRGALNLYAARPHAFTEQDLAAARGWAEEASAALVLARWIHQYDTQVNQLREGIVSNQLIGQATGLLMAEARCTSDVAFQTLKRQSQHSNVKVVVIAEQLVLGHDQATADAGPAGS